MMADNTTLPGTGESVRTIDKSAKKTQVVAIDIGGTGAEAIATGTLPVSGTVTANLSATDNAVLDAIQTAVEVIDNITQPLTDNQLRATAVPISGTVTSNLSATDNAVLDSIQTAVETVAGSISATHAQVDVLSAPAIVLGAGTAEVGKLAAGSALIGKVGIDQATANANEVVVKSGTVTANLSATDNAVLDAIQTAVEVIDNITQPVTDTQLRATAVPVSVASIPSHAVTNAGTFATQATLQTGSAAIGKLAANSGIDIGDVDILSVIPGTAATNLGKAEDAAHTSGDVGVMALGVRNVAHAALSGTDGDYSPIAVDGEGCVLVVGNIAHDAADSDGPVKIGAKAITALSGMTVVAANDRTNLFADEDGILLVKPWVTNNDILCERVSNTDGNSTALTVFGATASCYNCITSIIVYNAHATTNGFIDLLDGNAGTIIATIPAPAVGGSVINFAVPLRQPTANTALYFDPSAAITTIYITFVGYKSKA
jgi:hypothetical protein